MQALLNRLRARKLHHEHWAEACALLDAEVLLNSGRLEVQHQADAQLLHEVVELLEKGAEVPPVQASTTGTYSNGTWVLVRDYEDLKTLRDENTALKQELARLRVRE